MNGELFHDALDLLDDDLIEAVDILRSKKRSYAGLWSLGVAACLCLVLVGAWMLRPRPSQPLDGHSGSAPGYNGGYYGQVDQHPNGGLEDGVGDSGQPIRIPAQVDILVLRSDGFAGVLTEDWADLSAGSLVKVRVSQPVDIPAGSRVLVWAETREDDVLYAEKIERMG